MSTLTEILINHGYAKTESEANTLAHTLSTEHLNMSCTKPIKAALETDSETKLRKLTDNHKTLASIMCGLIPRDQYPIHSLMINGHGKDLAKTDQLLSSIGIQLKHG